MPCKITSCPNTHDSPSLFAYYAPSADARRLPYIAALFVLIEDGTLKPRPSGEGAPSGDGEGYLHPNYSLNVKISPKTIKTIKKKVI